MSDPITRFSTQAGDYALYRPSYPRDAIDAVLDGFSKPDVADPAVRAGISSIALADAGARVFAVEPNANMRGSIPTRADIVVIDGTAEVTALPDHSVNIVTAFQAYHWFTPDRVLTEAARIGRARTRYAAVWNERDRGGSVRAGVQRDHSPVHDRRDGSATQPQ